MEKITQFIYILGFMFLMVTFMNGTSIHRHHTNQKLQDTACVTTTIRNHACHGNQCRNSTTYIHGCDTYDGGECDNLTVQYNIHNVSSWRNTTCDLYACQNYIFDANDCADANLTFRSCTNGDCHSGLSFIHGCFDSGFIMKQLTGPSVLDFLGIDDRLKDYFNIPCINLIFDVLSQRHANKKK
ncbi:unnamed protein product [Adineta ricciae]|uniref:Uncharacterized protein n=1 Tax=Adineta ricciae TaxID=249248 RepID=A0A815NS34_ADIRI|nr:unnamed protein product [Adineta ricciae]CAF1438308.1 unnamed protein product [Adineta ricciae]